MNLCGTRPGCDFLSARLVAFYYIDGIQIQLHVLSFVDILTAEPSLTTSNNLPLS